MVERGTIVGKVERNSIIKKAWEWPLKGESDIWPEHWQVKVWRWRHWWNGGGSHYICDWIKKKTLKRWILCTLISWNRRDPHIETGGINCMFSVVKVLNTLKREITLETLFYILHCICIYTIYLSLIILSHMVYLWTFYWDLLEVQQWYMYILFGYRACAYTWFFFFFPSLHNCHWWL